MSNQDAEAIKKIAVLNVLKALAFEKKEKKTLKKLYKKQGKKRKHDEIDSNNAANSAVNSVLTENCLNEIDVKDMIKEFGSTMFKYLYGELIFDTIDENLRQVSLLNKYSINNHLNNPKKISIFGDTSLNYSHSKITKKLIIMCLNQLISNNELQLTKEQFNSIEMIIYRNEILSKLYSEIKIYNDICNYNITEKSLKIILNIINKYLSLIKRVISPANLIDSTQLKCIPVKYFFEFIKNYNLMCKVLNCSDDANIGIEQSYYIKQYELIDNNDNNVFSDSIKKLNSIFPGGITFNITFGVYNSNVYPILYLKFNYNNNEEYEEEYQDYIIESEDVGIKTHTSLILETLDKTQILKNLNILLNCSKNKINLETLKTDLGIKKELEKNERSNEDVSKNEIEFKIALYDLIKCIILWNNKTNKLSYKELFLNVIKLLFILKLIGDQCQVDLIKNITENPKFDKNNIVMFQTNDKNLFEYALNNGLNTVDKEYNILIKK